MSLSGWAPLANISIGLLVVIGFMSGRIVPRSTVIDIRADRDGQLREASVQFEKLKEISDIWQKTAHTAEDARRTLETHLSMVMTEKAQQADLLRQLVTLVDALRSEANEAASGKGPGS
jgi:hypothetical protein